MEKRRNSKVIVIVALLIAVVGLSIGFAAFARDLNITFTDSNVTTSGDLDVKFIASDSATDTSTDVIGTVNNAKAANPAVIVDGTTISGLGATFTNKGQSVEYDFYVYNNSEYDAYLKTVDFLDYSDGKNKVCTPVEGTTESLVVDACNDIELSIVIAGETAFTSDASSFTTPKITSKDIVPVKVTITYKNGEGTSQLPNGDFSINFGGIKLGYSSLEG